MDIIQALIHKDLLVEYRSKQAFVTTLFFGFLVLIVGNFALSVAAEQLPIYAPGILWISFLFSGLLFLNHILSVEREENTFAGLLISPATAGHIFLGKTFSVLIFIIALQAILFPLFHIFFNYSFTLNSLWLFCIIILASIGYSALGVLISTMSLGLKNREVLLSVLMLPLLIPLLLTCVKSSIILLNHLQMGPFYNWLKLLIAFDVIYFVLSYWMYYWVLEEL